MDNIVIRQARESDLPEITDLMAELAEIGHIEIDIDTISANCHELMDNENSYILVAELSGAVVGAINFTTRQSIVHTNPHTQNV